MKKLFMFLTMAIFLMISCPTMSFSTEATKVLEANQLVGWLSLQSLNKMPSTGDRVSIFDDSENRNTLDVRIVEILSPVVKQKIYGTNYIKIIARMYVETEHETNKRISLSQKRPGCKKAYIVLYDCIFEIDLR